MSKTPRGDLMRQIAALLVEAEKAKTAESRAELNRQIAELKKLLLAP